MAVRAFGLPQWKQMDKLAAPIAVSRNEMYFAPVISDLTDPVYSLPSPS